MKISNPSMLALVDQINASSKDDRDHLKMAVDAIMEQVRIYELFGVTAVALINGGTVFAVEWDKP